MGGKKHFIIACIPAYNEERTIARVVIEAQKYVDKVLVCDDGSRDLTGEIAERLGAEVIRHDRNMGYGAALASLFERAREMGPDVMVTLDADMQHNPNDIPKLVKPILDGEADIVIGSRFLSECAEEVPRGRRLGIRAITKLARAASYKGLTDAQSGFRAYSRKAIELIAPTEQGMGASIEILLKAAEKGLRVREVPIKIRYDVERPSTHNPLYHGLEVVLSTVKHMSMRHPLLSYGVPGAVALLVAIAFWVWTLQIFAATRQVVTNIALVAIGATIVGLMLLTTAVILWVVVSVINETKYQK
jgi:glycosyltransferase involved in cell wall biosynthesis